MNSLIMQFPIKPLSVNSKFTQHFKTKRMIKSTSAHKFERVVNGLLVNYRKDIEFFTKAYNRRKYSLQLEVVMYVPEEEFFTKSGEVSLTCIDASNALKMLEDIIYKAMKLNDGVNVKVSSEKRPYLGKEWVTLVTVSEVPVPKSCYLDDKVLELRDLVT